VAAAPASYRDSWTGAAATAVTSEIEALAGHVGAASPCFAAAGDAVRGFGEALAQAQDVGLPALRRRWEEADADHAAAVAAALGRRDEAVAATPPASTPEDARLRRDEADRARAAAVGAADSALGAERAAVRREVDLLREGLRAHASRTGSALQAAVLVAVPDALVESAGLAGRAAGPWSSLADVLAGAVMRAAAEGALQGGALTDLREALASPPVGRTDELAALLDRARALGVPPPQYGAALEGYWTSRAADEAGIDLLAWDVTAGADANRGTIEAVYRYYADLYLEDPDLEWAGMAALIGPSFAAGFFDLAQFRGVAERLQDLPLPPGVRLPPGVEDLAQLGEDELAFYETTLLSMQKEIFGDMAPGHQAYREGGAAALEEMAAAGVLPGTTAQAWRDIASGDRDRVAAGNGALLLREQYEVIDDDYDRMRAHAPSGEAFTWALTLVGAPSIPGASGYPDVFPLEVAVETPGPERLGPWDNPAQGTAHVTTPFPDGNVADFDDRWALIEEDTLPAYRSLLDDDPGTVRALLEQDVGERVEQMRTLPHRLDDIAAQLADWDVRFEQ
ncbi:hypothetical protein WDZ16_09365, partial [Pseudokineococcus marinus]